MKLIVGLGNPGKKYEKTRHNIGCMVLDALHEKLQTAEISNWDTNKKFQATISGCTHKNEKLILAKPETFMNESGISVQAIGHFYKLSARDLIVVHDDKDIALGEIKIQTDRGSAGHNGIKSIIEHLGTQDFTRVRVGIKSDNEKKMSNVPKFVLGKFGIFERGTVKKIIDQAVEEIMKLV